MSSVLLENYSNVQFGSVVNPHVQNENRKLAYPLDRKLYMRIEGGRPIWEENRVIHCVTDPRVKKGRTQYVKKGAVFCQKKNQITNVQN